MNTKNRFLTMLLAIGFLISSVAFVHASNIYVEKNIREAQKEAIRAARENEKIKIQEMRNSNATKLQKRAEIHKVRAVTQKNIRAMQDTPRVEPKFLQVSEQAPQRNQSYFESFINIFRLWQ